MELTLADIDNGTNLPDFGKGSGLLPVIVQHAERGSVLMLAYMNLDALRATAQRRRMVFYSRSRARLWEKGETSGHTLELVSLAVDCDRDTLLALALPKGPVCHLGTTTCFGDAAPSGAERLGFLPTLERVLEQRIVEQPEGSYTARLHAEGTRRMAQKVGEEGLELALAAASGNDDEVVAEAADLLYHVTLLLRSRGLTLASVSAELERRHAAR
jgi:phosphoribosyl-ATP pyrophosphohydrolase/phosphoribosyl-AMP cyclohydrolase